MYVKYRVVFMIFCITAHAANIATMFV